MEIKVYEVTNATLRSRIIYDNPRDAVEELKIHLEVAEAGDCLHITVYKMEKDKYENLSEFQGW